MMKTFLKKCLACCMLLCLLFSSALAAEDWGREVIMPYPEELQINVVWEEWTRPDGSECDVPVPYTCREDVDDQLHAAQQELWQDVLAHAEETDKIEMLSTYRVTGEKWAGFLMTGRVVRVMPMAMSTDRDQTVYLCYRVFTYDMQTGEALTLADVFAPTSEAWAQIAEEVEATLRAFYAEEPRDEEWIRAACEKDQLAQMSFLPGAGRLVLPLPLWPMMENHYQLANTILYYPDYRSMMTETAFAQTDNSHRPIVAVTYDDGPSLFYSPWIRKHLATYGASATFFCIGKHMVGLADGLRGTLDYAHSIGSHTYEHKYEFQLIVRQLKEDRQLCIDTQRELLGVEPTLFRAPGGHCEKYVEGEVGWPIILWSYSAGDTGDNNYYQLARRITTGSENGDILLMHDIREKTADGSELFLKEMTRLGFMFATVDELMALHGVEIEPNKVYYSAFEQEE